MTYSESWITHKAALPLEAALAGKNFAGFEGVHEVEVLPQDAAI